MIDSAFWTASSYDCFLFGSALTYALLARVASLSAILCCNASISWSNACASVKSWLTAVLVVSLSINVSSICFWALFKCVNWLTVCFAWSLSFCNFTSPCNAAFVVFTVVAAWLIALLSNVAVCSLIILFAACTAWS